MDMSTFDKNNNNNNNNNKKEKNFSVCIISTIYFINLLKAFIFFLLSLQCNLCCKFWVILVLIRYVPCQHDESLNKIGECQCPSGSVPCHCCFCHCLSHSHWLGTEKTLDGEHLEINEFKEMEYLICIDCANAIALLFSSAYQNVIWRCVHHWKNTCKLE